MPVAYNPAFSTVHAPAYNPAGYVIPSNTPNWSSWNGSTDSASVTLAAGDGTRSFWAACPIRPNVTLFAFGAAHLMLVLCDTSSGAPVWGTPVSLVVPPDWVSLSQVATGKAIMCYRSSSNGIARIINVSGSSIDTTPAPTTFEIGPDAVPVSVAANSATKAITTYTDFVNFLAQVLIINGDDTITLSGSELIIDPDPFGLIPVNIQKVTSTTSLIQYINADLTASVGRVLTINGDNTLSKGATRNITTGTNVFTNDLATIQSGVYVGTSYSDAGYATVITVSGTTVNSGMPQGIGISTAYSIDINAVRAADDIVMIIYGDQITARTTGIVGTISGTSLSLLTPHQIVVEQTTDYLPVNVDDSHIMLGYVNANAGFSKKGILLIAPN